MTVGLWRGISAAIYPLDSGANDISGNANDGTPNNMTWGLGRVGDCGVFDGANSKIYLPNNAGLKPTNFSIACWYKGTESGTLMQNWNLTSSKYYGFILDIYLTHLPRLVVAKGTGTTAGTDYTAADAITTVHDGKWHWIVGTFDGSEIKIYVDGKLEATTAFANTVAYAATQYPMIGVREDAVASYSTYLTGSVDEVILRATAWSAQDIRRIYAWSKGML